MKHHIFHKGAVALVSILIITAFTLVLAVSLSDANRATSDQYLNNVMINDLYYAAEGCLDEALLRTEGDTTFTGTTLTFTDGTSCTVTVTGTTTKTMTIVVQNGDYTENFVAQAAVTQSGVANNLRLLSLEAL